MRSSALFKLYIVTYCAPLVCCMAQEGVPGVFQHFSHQIVSCRVLTCQQSMIDHNRLPFLYIFLVPNVLGRAISIPYFISGFSHPTISHSVKDCQPLRSGLTRCSTFCEVNIMIWIWHYGRGSPMLIRQRFARKSSEQVKVRASETSKRLMEAAERGLRPAKKHICRVNHIMIIYIMSCKISYNIIVIMSVSSVISHMKSLHHAGL